jgi:hypothetical protein
MVYSPTIETGHEPHNRSHPMNTKRTASQIKLAYWISSPVSLSYEAALSALKAIGYGESEADDYLHLKDADRRVADIKNGDLTEGPALLAAQLPKIG